MRVSIDIQNEQLLAISDVPDFLPRRRKKKIHISTVYRWLLKGARGKILESVMIGGIRYTSQEALRRFMNTEMSDLLDNHRLNRIKDQLAKSKLSVLRDYQ